MTLPAMRYVDAFPLQHEGETWVCLSDPLGIIEEQVVLSPLAYFAAAQLTGTNTFEDIREIVAKQFNGTHFTSEQMDDIIRTLDERGYLLTENFEKIQNEAIEAFRSNPNRPAFLAGKSYPDDPEELATFLNDQFTREGGPHETLSDVVPDGESLRGLIVPHIDFGRGGHSYAHGYLRLYKAAKPDTIFIFGVAHMAQPAPFILTRKHFETPLGLVETDTEIVDELAKACSWDPFEYEFSHRNEHSIEFHAVMLAHLYGSDVRIVPILCSAFSEDPTLNDPTSLESVTDFLAACRRCAEREDKKVSFIAAADLAHVGKRFGDPFDIDDAIIDRVAERDSEDLAFAEQCKPEDFYGSVMKDMNERRVCGLNCIYATLKSLEGVIDGGESIHYDYAHDPAGGIVSFASVALL